MSLRALFYRRPSEPQAIEVIFERSVYLVRVRRHRQARRYTLRIDAASRAVVLTIPPRGSLKEAREFAQKHGAWIAARLKRLPQATPFEHGGQVPLRGIPHRIVYRKDERGAVWTERNGDGERLVCVTGQRPHHNRRIGDFLKREAKRDLDAASRRYAEQLGVTIARISVRDQSSRWGSCSSTGVLSFSWRLILAPQFVLEYLAAHEVTHLVELNHSPRFWRLLKRLNPDTERAKAWLDTHGTDLHRYGVPPKPGRGLGAGID
jgi:predicted metal-dependent hydrolase